MSLWDLDRMSSPECQLTVPHLEGVSALFVSSDTSMYRSLTEGKQQTKPCCQETNTCVYSERAAAWRHSKDLGKSNQDLDRFKPAGLTGTL